MIEEKEIRTFAAELRVTPPSVGKKGSTIRGYAAKFNTLSEAMPIMEEGRCVGTFREQLLPGCFAGALPTSDVRALINHDPNLILGRNVSGTLRMMEDDTGLMFDNDPPETSYAKDIQVSMQRGDVSQCSFGFSVANGGDSYTKDPDVKDGYIRSIRSISRLFDVSVVTYPAYTDTSCAVRSIVSQIKEEDDRVAASIREQEAAELKRSFEYKRRQLELAEASVVR